MTLISRTKTYAAIELLDDDGIKTAFASSVAPATLTAADWNGAVVLTGGILDLPRIVTIGRSNSVGQFSTAPIVATYLRGGLQIVENIVPTTPDGNDILRLSNPVDTLVSIAFPAQGGAGGTFKIGVQDICAPKGDCFAGVELAANGNLCVQYGELGSQQDTIPVVVANRCFYEVPASRVLTAAGKTAVGVTVYLRR